MMRASLLVPSALFALACQPPPEAPYDPGLPAGYVFEPLPTRAACEDPDLSPGEALSVGGGAKYALVRVAFGGTEAAVAFVTAKPDGGYTLGLQRLTPKGRFLERTLTLASGNGPVPAVAIAADDTRFLVAWDGADGRVHVSSVPLAKNLGPPVPGFEASGAGPSLARGGGGFLLAYRGDTGLRLQRLAGDASALGPTLSRAEGEDARPRVVPTASGFAVAYAPKSDLPWNLHRVNFKLDPVGEPALVSLSGRAPMIGLAAVGEKVLAVWRDHTEPAQIVRTFFDEAGAMAERVPVNTVKDPQDGVLAAIAGADSFAVTWADEDGYIGYRSLDAAGEPIGLPGFPFETFAPDSAHDLVPVSDGFLLATASGAKSDNLQLIHLGCP